jgi:hypothetical protein
LCILFGSQAIGKAPHDSDVNIILILTTHSDLNKNMSHFIDEAKSLFDYPVKPIVVDMDGDPELLLEIFQHGRLLYESRPDLFLERRILAIRIHEDTEPLRRFRNKARAPRAFNPQTLNY